MARMPSAWGKQQALTHNEAEEFRMTRNPWKEFPVGAWKPTMGFWADRIKVSRVATLPHVLRQLEVGGRLENFTRVRDKLTGGFRGQYRFNDSDVYKTLEGVAYHLALEPDDRLEQQADAIVDIVAAAQQSDGYLFTWNQLGDREQRWTDMNSRQLPRPQGRSLRLPGSADDGRSRLLP
jgi:hypothetical protein